MVIYMEGGGSLAFLPQAPGSIQKNKTKTA